MTRDVFRRSGLVSAIAVFILLGAVLPNVAYLGHAQPAPSNTPRNSSGQEHALHCHAGPAGCAGAQAMVGAVWVGEDSGLITPARETRTTPDSSQPATPDAPVIRILKPPRAV